MIWQIPALRVYDASEDIIYYVAVITAGDAWLMAQATPETRTSDIVLMSVRDEAAEWGGLNVKNAAWSDITDETLAGVSETLGILMLNKTGAAEFVLLAVPPKFYTSDIESGHELIVKFVPVSEVVGNV